MMTCHLLLYSYYYKTANKEVATFLTEELYKSK